MTKIILQYKCRRCGEIFFDKSTTYIKKVEHIWGIPSLFLSIHQCDDTDLNDGSKRFGICDLIGCKEE